MCAKLTLQHTYDMTPGRLGAWEWGPVASTYGGSRTAFHCVPKSVPQNIRLCVAQERSSALFGGPGTVFPRVPPYFNHWVGPIVYS